MNDNVLYELVVEKRHIDLMIKALSNYMCSQYDGIDLEVVDVPVTIENIKIASDMQLVLKHQLGTTRHTPKQTSQTTGLIWIKEVFAPQEGADLNDQAEPFEPFNDEGLQDNSKSLQEAWNNVKERHWDTIKRMGDK